MPALSETDPGGNSVSIRLGRRACERDATPQKARRLDHGRDKTRLLVDQVPRDSGIAGMVERVYSGHDQANRLQLGEGLAAVCAEDRLSVPGVPSRSRFGGCIITQLRGQGWPLTLMRTRVTGTRLTLLERRLPLHRRHSIDWQARRFAARPERVVAREVA